MPRVDGFRRSWKDRAVVLVEGSDIVRADAYRSYASAVHRNVLERQALHRTDALFGRLLEHVDLRRDAVIVVGPAHSTRAITLTVLGIQGPGVEPGLLRSATTRRSGFVQLIDVAPTILDLMHIDRPTSMEGRPVEVGADGGSAAGSPCADRPRRRGGSVPRSARRRGADGLRGVHRRARCSRPYLLFRKPRPVSWRDRLGTVALCVLGFAPATFIVRVFPVHEWGFVPVLGARSSSSPLRSVPLYRRIGRDRYLDGLLAALLVPIVLLLVDVLVGTPLQFNSALGYSPTVAGRFTGFSNPAYAIVAASSVIAAPLLAHRIGGRRGAWAGIALLGCGHRRRRRALLGLGRRRASCRWSRRSV